VLLQSGDHFGEEAQIFPRSAVSDRFRKAHDHIDQRINILRIKLNVPFGHFFNECIPSFRFLARYASANSVSVLPPGIEQAERMSAATAALKLSIFLSSLILVLHPTT
jgi:hypothetical protein